MAIATALSHSLITGIDNCDQEGRALTQLQQIDLAVMSHLTAYTQTRDFLTLIEMEATIKSMVDRGMIIKDMM